MGPSVPGGILHSAIQIGQRIDALLFPKREIYSHPLPFWQGALAFIGLTLLLSLTGLFLRPGGMIGFDWIHFFSTKVSPPFYPPWTTWVLQGLSWPLLLGLTLTAFGIASFQRARYRLSVALAFFSLPLLWTLFLGQLDGLALMGVLGLPWLAPLALIKPQVSLFAFGARRSSLLALVAVLVLSFLLWGYWPAQMLAHESYLAEGRYVNNISLGLYGLPLFLATVWASRGDPDMLMLSGSFITPYLIPYSFLPLTPAIARLHPAVAFIAVLLSWLPLSANWLGDSGWWLGWLFIAWTWIHLANARYRKKNDLFLPIAIAKWLAWQSPTAGQGRNQESAPAPP